VAPISDRWREVAALQESFPALLAPPPRRLYALEYLAGANLAQFLAQFLAGKLRALQWLDKLEYGQDDLGLVVISELVSVYLLYGADGRYWLLLGQGALTQELPVPGRLLLWGLLSRRKQILL